MLLTVSKRLEFSASRRLFDPQSSEAENLARFGEESAARYGTGRNYVAYFVFSGVVDPETGMLINISEIKRRAGEIIDAGFDHKFLNEDNSAFAEAVPTAENVAKQLFTEVEPLFRGGAAKLVACHLQETAARSATAYAGGVCDANFWFEFSAARQTTSPQLSAQENEQLFGAASSPFGHGHHYRARLTLRDSLPAVHELIHSLGNELDHKNLNREVPGLGGRAITTESLATYIFERASKTTAIERVRLHERDDFFAEHWRSGADFVGMRKAFSAAHRLHVRTLSVEQNTELFGKCNNLRGHGHRYLAEATIGGALDKRSGTLCNFSEFQRILNDAIKDWDNRHLDLETKEFRERPSTGENIVQALWDKLNPRLTNRLERLRLWETNNNRFTLRR
ncbi:MAG: 6-carboxytetrahydropterin synthase [Verrucomicrobiota bacterium]|nr:6-carboxytetrahydropterin synthase [Verrucomicrobiota bacterium]MDQ6939771.1 6-carboxytetrahydropterin synthase [Verrucomicrobiota bacterium]